MSGTSLELTAERRQAVARLMSAWWAAWSGPEDHAGPAEGEGPADSWIDVRDVELLVTGRPAVLDVVADMRGRLAHAVLGLRRPEDEEHLLRGGGEESVLGLFEDDHGLGAVVDALGDPELASQVLRAVTGDEDVPAGVTQTAKGEDAVVLAFGERMSLTVFPWLSDGPHPGLAMLVALDEAGFNHLPAPLALWRRGGRDLGFVQELLVGSAEGWALALTSLRDLYASGGAPEDAGGDFGSEAVALGTMTARMHLALEKAFGTRDGDVTAWVEAVEAAVRTADPLLLEDEGVTDRFRKLRSARLRAPSLRTHGDFTLARIARTDQGWVVTDCMPGGVVAGSGSSAPVFRSPLADIADMAWSFHRISSAAAAERDPSGQSGLGELARAWEERNRRALLDGYLSTPGIDNLVPADRETARDLVDVFELRRAAGLALGAER